MPEVQANCHVTDDNHHKVALSQGSSKIDPIFELVQQCKIDNLLGGRGFIHSVNQHLA